MPLMVRLAGELGASPEAAIAVASLLQLTEAMLSRPLAGACCCDPKCSADERAVLMLLAYAPDAGTVRTSDAVPHGLAGPLVWAAISVRIALGIGSDDRHKPERCPFALGNSQGA